MADLSSQFPNPMVMQILNDRLRQQQWERAQNARIAQEQRAAQMKASAEELKWLRGLGVEAVKAGLPTDQLFLPNGQPNVDAILQSLGRQGALDRGEKVDKQLAPLAKAGGALPRYRPGTAEPSGTAGARQDFGANLVGAGIANNPAALNRLGILMGGERTEIAAGIAEREAQLGKEARLPVAKRKAMEADERRLRGIANRLTAEGKHGTQEWQDAAESYLRAKMQLGKFVSAEGRTISISDEGVEITEGGSGRMVTQQMRAIENINNVDAIREDARVALSMIEANPSIAGTAGGLTNIMNTFAGVMTDVANMASGDILADMVDQELADHLESNIMGDGEIQGLKLIEMAMAYSWVRSKRGSRRITMEEYKKALENLRLHGGWTSSNQVESRIKWFLRDMNRKARQNRSKIKSAWGLDVPDTSYEPLPSGVRSAPSHKPVPMRPDVEQGLQGLGLEGP